jgi:hypothetical protein
MSYVYNLKTNISDFRQKRRGTGIPTSASFSRKVSATADLVLFVRFASLEDSLLCLPAATGGWSFGTASEASASDFSFSIFARDLQAKFLLEGRLFSLGSFYYRG